MEMDLPRKLRAEFLWEAINTRQCKTLVCAPQRH